MINRETRIRFLGVVTGVVTTLIIFFGKPEAPILNERSVKDIAFILKGHNNVQRKREGNIIWENVVPGNLLFLNDVVRTGVNSSAKIGFKESESRITIDENSMFTVKKASDKLSLNLLEGDISIDSKDSMEILSGNKKMKLDKAKVSLRVDNSGNLNFEVLDGQVLAQLEGKSKTIQKLEKASIGDRSITKEKVIISTKIPEHNSSVYLDKYGKSKFEWLSDLSNQTYYLYIGENKNKLRKVRTIKYKTNTTIKLRPGFWHWKIVAKGRGVVSETKTYRVHVLPRIIPELLSPENGKDLIVRNGVGVLRWRPLNEAKEKIYVYDDAKLKKLLFEKDTNGKSSFEVSNLDFGKKYFWKIISYRDNDIIESKVSSFRYVKSLQVRSPIIEYPIDEKIVSDGGSSEVLFSWDGSEGVSSYIIEVYKDNKVSLRKELLDNKFSLSDLKIGNYKWRVRSEYSNKKLSKFSSFSKFQIYTLPLIEVDQLSIKGFFTKNKAYPLSWKKKSGVESYKIIVRNKEASGSSFNEYSRTESVKLQFQRPGRYEVTIQGYDKKSELVTKSRPLLVSLLELPLLGAPKLTKDVVRGDGRGDAKVRFSPLEGAKYYLAEVLDKNGSLVQITRFEKSPGNLRGLQPGSYNVFLKGIDMLERSGEKSRSIKVNIPNEASLEAVKIKRVRIR